MSENNQSMKSKDAKEKAFAEEIEKLARPLCEKIQSLPEDARKNFRAQDVLTHHERSLRHDLLLKIFHYMDNSAKYKQNLDDLTCVEVFDDTLQSYKAESYEGEVHHNEKLGFWKYFRNQYRRRILPWKYRPVEEVGLRDINYDVRGRNVKDFLYSLVERQQLSKDEMEALDLSEKKKCVYYAKEDNVLGILARLGYDKDSKEAQEVKSLLAQTNLDYYDQTVSLEDETANRYAALDRIAYKSEREEEIITNSLLWVSEKAFQVARETSRYDEKYLKGYLTLLALFTQDELPKGMRPYIIASFFEEQHKKAYPPEVSDSKIELAQKVAMAEHLGVAYETWRKKMKELQIFFCQIVQIHS